MAHAGCDEIGPDRGHEKTTEVGGPLKYVHGNLKIALPNPSGQTRLFVGVNQLWRRLRSPSRPKIPTQGLAVSRGVLTDPGRKAGAPSSSGENSGLVSLIGLFGSAIDAGTPILVRATFTGSPLFFIGAKVGS